MDKKTEKMYAGPEREFEKFFAHIDPEVRGLALLLVEKLADSLKSNNKIIKAVNELKNDPDNRVVKCAERAQCALRKPVEKAADTLIPVHGHYEELESYKTASIIYQGSVAFCKRFISKYSRTTDQMVQAARSGKQNIVEGCSASGTSKKTELKLVGVARASLDELLEDYKDFLLHSNLPVWDKNHPQSKKIRVLAYAENRSYETYRSYIENSSPEVAANTMLCLIHQANYLLDRQLKSLEKEFLEQGGFSERLYKCRTEKRNKRYR